MRDPAVWIAEKVVRGAARFVPRLDRTEWTEEWLSELDALGRARQAQPGGGLPGPVPFALGAIRHAVWTMREGWTMRDVLQDLRFAIRVLSRAPGFTLVAAGTLALGIGANASMFSVVNGLLLRSPPGVVEPDRLVQVARSYDQAPRWDNWSWPAMKEIGNSDDVFESVAGYTGRALVVGEGPDAELMAATLVTGSWFSTLGVRPHVGRLLQPADDVTPGGHPVVVLSHDLWQRRFGGARDVVGQTVPVGGEPYEIVGVAPPGFRGIDALGSTPQIYVPTAMYPPFRGELPFDRWGSSWIYVIARLAPDVPFETATAAMDGATTRLRAASDVNDDIRVLLAEGVGLDPEERAQARTLAMLLMGIAALILVLTCANVANLFIARGTSRETEMGVRLALGAGRGRLARQLGTESLLLGLVAAALAVPLVVASGRLLPALIPYTLATSLDPDARVLGVIVAMGIVAGLLFGFLPAVRFTRRDLTGALREGASRGNSGRTRGRDALVVSQLAVSLGLLTGAALLGRSVLNAWSTNPGFEPRGLVAAYLSVDGTGRYDRPAAVALHERIAREMAGVPGVAATSFASQAPFLGPFARSSVAPVERKDDPNASIEAEEVYVGGNYFETMGMPLLTGRTLADASLETERVAVVNETLARMFWPGEDAVGKMLSSEEPMRVVGVVADARVRSLRGPARPAVYQPFIRSYTGDAFLHVRTSAGMTGLPARVRELVAGMDPGVPVSRIDDIHGRMTASLGETRTFGTLVATFAALALVLSVVGLYGLISYRVSNRVREMGIRLALGAKPDAIVRMVVGRGVALAVAGVAVGLLLSLALGRALEGLLFGVSARSPLSLALAAVVLLAAATAAAWLPARRASRIDAAESLRQGT